MPSAPARIDPCRAFWRRDDVRDERTWTHVLTPSEIEDFARVVRTVELRGPSSLTRADLPTHGPIAEAALHWRRELRDGLGFVRVRGLPVDAFAPSQLESGYVALGLYLGAPVPQTLKGELLTHVRDIGADPTLPSTRLYTTRAEQDFHTDAADIIGLLCRRGARAGGLSRIASSGAIVLEIQRTRPDLFPTLFEDFPWHYQEPGSAPRLFTRPICAAPVAADGTTRLNTFFIPWYIRRSQLLAEAPRLTAAQQALIGLIEQLANRPEYHLDMDFAPGDIQWLKNAAILHKRTAYDDHENADQKRHLLRLWLNAPDFADGDAQLRHGIDPQAPTVRVASDPLRAGQG